MALYRKSMATPSMCAKSLQSCLTLCDPVDCSPPSSSVYGIPQAGILEWVAMPSSRGSSWPRDRTHISTSTCIYRWVFFYPCASLVAQRVNNLPAMQETGVQSLGQEDALKKGIASHSSILAWRILWTENPDGLHSMGLQRVRHDWATNTHSLFITSATREARQPRDHQSNVASPGFPNSSSHCPLFMKWGAEDQPRLIQGIRRGDGVGDLFKW